MPQSTFFDRNFDLSAIEPLHSALVVPHLLSEETVCVSTRVAIDEIEASWSTDIALAALLLTHPGISSTLRLGKIGYMSMA